MISRRLSLPLTAAALILPQPAAAQEAQPVPAPPRTVYVPPAPHAPPPPPAHMQPGRPPRPLASGLRVVDGPDWANPDIYPAAAMRLDQEGPVRFELLVGRDGRPHGCTIVESSGHAELDAGTCRLATTMRFAPPGEETRTRLRVVWLLAPDPMPFVPHRMVATLDLTDGAVTGCTLDGEGPLFRHWSRVACRTFTLEGEYYLGARRFSAKRATIVIDMVPDGRAIPLVPAGRGALTGIRRTAFIVNSDGNPGGCSTLENRGFGFPRIDHSSACGLFMAQGLEFVAAEQGEAETRRGTVVVRALVETAPRARARR